MTNESRYTQVLSQGRSFLNPKQRSIRVVHSLPATIQIIITALVSYAIAFFVVNHPQPVIAVTLVIGSLGFQRDARPLRVMETAIGMIIGVIVSEVFVILLGQGILQLGIILFVTLVVARFLSATPSFAVAAAIQSVIIMILPISSGGIFTKTIDAVIGGGMAVLATALIPRNPRRTAQRDAMCVFGEFSAIVRLLVSVLRSPDTDISARTLARARSAESLVAAWKKSLDSALAIARISPFLRKQLPHLQRQHIILGGVELAMRNLRVISRRVDYVAHDQKPHPEAAATLASLLEGIDLLRRSIDNLSAMEQARDVFTQVAEHLDPLDAEDTSLAETSIVLQLRPFVVDLLCAAGMSPAEAQKVPPPLE